MVGWGGDVEWGWQGARLKFNEGRKTCDFMSISTVLQPYKNYERLCAMEPVMFEKIQSTGLEPGTASPAGQPLTY